MADGKQIRDRIFAMSGAVLFLISTVAVAVIVIVQLVQENNQKKAVDSATNSQTSGNKLKGKKLEGFTPVAEVTTVQVTDLKVGEGKEVTSADNTVTADYTGALASDGTIFESSLDSGQPFTAPLTGVIKGWQTGMVGMKEGGKRRLVIPAADAYGPQASQDIPANSNLVFDITLIKVQ